MMQARSGRLYPLTSLQIGDIQSYVSRLYLLVASEGFKLVFLVDNGPWTLSAYRSRPAELWQLMVTKSRLSPFANRRQQCVWDENGGAIVEDTGKQGLLTSSDSHGRDDRWTSLVDSLRRHCKELALMKKPSHGLYGCVAFEVAWEDVRGINYVNELQTDTCVALEVRNMTKREFDSLEQAQACYATILSGPKDLGPYLSVAKLHGIKGKASSTIVRCAGQDRNFHGLVESEGSSRPRRERDAVTAKALVGAKSRDEFNSGRKSSARLSSCAETKHLKKRHINETGWLGDCRSRQRGTGEYGRAYVNAVPPRFSSRLDSDVSGNSLPDFLTPPSSPYGGQTFQNHFKNHSTCQYSDAKKIRIWPSDQIFEEVRGGRHKVDSGLSTSLETLGQESLKSVYSVNKSADLARSSFGTRLPSGNCSSCQVPREHAQLERSQDQAGRDSIKHVQPERVYVHPDRLIAPADIYHDTLILFRFSEPTLPIELRRIITADQRLLKMLESGLPPWVIFLQSYPIFCNLYRPWMRPLCGTIYYLVSIVTVLIGFYDLYKNVPVLKASAAHICGPLFQWIEEWGMISRLKYLGTMLFLQNCQKAFHWFIVTVRASQQVSMLLMRPVLQPLILVWETVLPLWATLVSAVQTMVKITSSGCTCIALSIWRILQILASPYLAFLSTVCNLGVTLLSPVFSTLWTVLTFPWQMIRLFVNLVTLVSSGVIDGVQDVWGALSNSFQLALASGSPALCSLQAVKSSPGPSLWRNLWNDIFSKVFHAVRGIVKGLVAFFTACNRHRLSIYNHLVACLLRMTGILRSQAHEIEEGGHQPEHEVDACVYPGENWKDTVAEPTHEQIHEFSSELLSFRHRLKRETEENT